MGDSITSDDFARAVVVEVSHFDEVKWIALGARRVGPDAREGIVWIKPINLNCAVVEIISADHNGHASTTLYIAQFKIMHTGPRDIIYYGIRYCPQRQTG